uniref:Peptidase S8/S53 domain-containing protein n=1 Tax=Tetradesmus obliquus TaxID=3088 RepID=A0A383WF35_TETOB|eukprot:jgi/Sobl393_1/5022/SZX75870.1
MVSFTFFVTVLLLAQHAACRLGPTSGSQQQSIQEDSGIASTPDLDHIISGQFLLHLADDVVDAAAAGEVLVSEVQAAMEAAAPSVSNGVVTAAAHQASAFKVLRTLGSAAAAEPAAGVAAAAAAAAASGPAAAGAAAAPRTRSLLVSAPDSAIEFMKASSVVKAVVKDRVVASQQTACVERSYLQKGITATPLPSFKWAGCMTPRSKLIWRASACSGGKISYIEIRSVDRVTNAPIMNNRVPCVLSLAGSGSLGATFVRQRFGACGQAPSLARTLPTRICSATGGNTGAGGSSGTTNPNSGGTGSTGATTGNPGTPPTTTMDGGPSGFTQARVPLTSGDQIPSGVGRIEGGSAAAVFSIAGVPADRQVVVGVVDSGIDDTHPDLNVIGGSSWVIPSAKVAGDVADADVDKYGHGTHVAGIVAAKNNGAGVVGIAPGLPLYSLKVLDAQGVGALSDAMAAVEWAASADGKAKANIRVINLSLAAYIAPTDPDYQATMDLVCASFKAASDAGIVVIAAAGNYASDTRGYLPASCPTVIAVTSMDPASNTPSSFSNFMPADAAAADKNRVIAAPGNGILSTISYAREASGYRELSGTSMASPHVAGVAATCFLSGACPTSGVAGIDQLTTLQAAAKERLAQSADYGFAGDASSTANGKFYGSLLWAKF